MCYSDLFLLETTDLFSCAHEKECSIHGRNEGRNWSNKMLKCARLRFFNNLNNILMVQGLREKPMSHLTIEACIFFFFIFTGPSLIIFPSWMILNLNKLHSSTTKPQLRLILVLIFIREKSKVLWNFTQFNALGKYSLYLSDGQKMTSGLGFNWHTGCLSTQHSCQSWTLAQCTP